MIIDFLRQNPSVYPDLVLCVNYKRNDSALLAVQHPPVHFLLRPSLFLLLVQSRMLVLAEANSDPTKI